MSSINITLVNTPHKKKLSKSTNGMHPGGGFVAWPDGRKTETNAAQKERMLTVCRGCLRKGFAAWPERE